jgi:hypothetical protein
VDPILLFLVIILTESIIILLLKLPKVKPPTRKDVPDKFEGYVDRIIVG